MHSRSCWLSCRAKAVPRSMTPPSSTRALPIRCYAGVSYESKLVYASVSYANKEAGALKFDGATAGVNIIRGAVYVNPVAALELSALVQQAKGIDQDGATNGNQLGGDRKETSFLVGAAYSLKAWKFKAAFGQTKGDASDIKRDGPQPRYRLQAGQVIRGAALPHWLRGQEPHRRWHCRSEVVRDWRRTPVLVLSRTGRDCGSEKSPARAGLFLSGAMAPAVILAPMRNDYVAGVDEAGRGPPCAGPCTLQR